MPAEIWFNTLVVGCMYALLGVSFAVIYNTTRIFDFNFAGIYVLTAYTGHAILNHTTLPLPVVVVLSALVGTLVALAIFHFVYRPLMIRNTSFLGMAILTLGVATILENVTSIIFSPTFQAMEAQNSTIAKWSTQVGSVNMSGVELLILGSVPILVIGFYWFFARTRYGLYVRAIGMDPEFGVTLGLNRIYVAYVAFFVGYLLAGVATILISLETRTISPSMGHPKVLIAIVAVLLGGRGNLPAAALGGLVLAFFETLTGWYISSSWTGFLTYMLLLLVLVVRPQGIFGRKISWIGR